MKCIWKRSWLNVWFNYPITLAALFMNSVGWKLYGHVVVVGPLAFVVMWRKKR